MKKTLIIIAVFILAAALAATLFVLLRKPAEESYPVEYSELVKRYSEENGVPPALTASVIFAESSYRPDVVSSAGAIGLMQIMPDTGEWIAGKYDEEFAIENLYDPETNIRYGTWYLGFLLARYDGNTDCAVAAYHAGQGNVDKWLSDGNYSSDGVTLENIPFESTATYVQRINKYLKFYSGAYAENEADN